VAKPAPHVPITRVLGALTDAGCEWRVSETQTDSWTAQCPAHEDRSPSLLVTRKFDGKVLLYCRAFCPTPAILRALGLEWVDLWERKEDDPSVDGYVRRSRRHIPPERIEALRLIAATLNDWERRAA
jgi:hypothetical protein